jgi:hypothetical protein
MRPRTVAIVVVLLLLGAVGLRFLVVRYALLPVSEEAVLQRAVGLTIHYEVGGVPKSLSVSDAELSEAMATLKIRKEDYTYYYGGGGRGFGGQSQVDFHFPDGSKQTHVMYDKTQMGQFVVNQSFHDKLCDIVSRHEKKKIDRLGVPAAPFGAPGQGFNGGPGFDEQDLDNGAKKVIETTKKFDRKKEFRDK